jgi:hypothetical protein
VARMEPRQSDETQCSPPVPGKTHTVGDQCHYLAPSPLKWPSLLPNKILRWTPTHQPACHAKTTVSETGLQAKQGAQENKGWEDNFNLSPKKSTLGQRGQEKLQNQVS